MQLLETETIFSPTGPPIAPLPSPVKVYNQDSDPASSVREEPSVVAEPSRPRPSTVTVIHTGTKWRQVPREVSWETTELWDGMKPSKASWVDVVAQFAYPATSHLFLPTTGGIWGALSQLHLPWLSTAPPPSPRRSSSHCHTDLEVQRGRCSPEAVVEAMFSLDPGCLADKQAAGLESATLKGTLYWSCYHFWLWASWDGTLLLYALCKYPAWNCWVESMLCKWNIQ